MSEDILSLSGLDMDSISLISPRIVPAIMNNAAALSKQLRNIVRMTDSIVQDSSALVMTLIGEDGLMILRRTLLVACYSLTIFRCDKSCHQGYEKSVILQAVQSYLL